MMNTQTVDLGGIEPLRAWLEYFKKTADALFALNIPNFRLCRKLRDPLWGESSGTKWSDERGDSSPLSLVDQRGVEPLTSTMRM